jgi:hypothetical protein
MFGLSKAVHGLRNQLWDKGTAVQKAGEHVRIMVGCRSLVSADPCIHPTIPHHRSRRGRHPRSHDFFILERDLDTATCPLGSLLPVECATSAVNLTEPQNVKCVPDPQTNGILRFAFSRLRPKSNPRVEICEASARHLARDVQQTCSVTQAG